MKGNQWLRDVIACMIESICTQQGDGMILYHLAPQFLQPRRCRQILVTQLADHLSEDAHLRAVSIARTCSGSINEATDGGFEHGLIQHAAGDKSCQQLFRFGADKLPRALVSIRIDAFKLQPESDRFAMIVGHDEDNTLTVAKSSTRKQGNRLPDETFISVRIHDVAARVGINQNRSTLAFINVPSFLLRYH
jgi:hypothetical protein